MPIVLGLNIGTTSAGIPLMDGGGALLQDGRVIAAVAGERITRRKYDGDARQAIPYLLQAAGLRVSDLDAIAVSSCCDTPPTVWDLKQWLSEFDPALADAKIVAIPSHHLSHAYGAFYGSGFQEALIVVADNEGNILHPLDGDYWANTLERTSYYVGRGADITLIDRDAPGPGDIGIGATYNAFTQWIGFDDYQSAYKVMGLAPYGSRARFGALRAFDTDKEGRIHSRLEPNPNASLAVRRMFFAHFGRDLGLNPLGSTSDPSDLQKDTAAFIQSELERAVIERLKGLVKTTGQRKLVFSGGVALNCSLIGEIERTGLFSDIYVFPASGDTGQCFGNALWTERHCFGSPRTDESIVETCYWGMHYSQEVIKKTAESFSGEWMVRELPDEELIAEMARLLNEGEFIFHFNGPSEFGPRALGNRSIFASPDTVETRANLNRVVKEREWYRPFSPSIPAGRAREYFEGDGSSLMTTTCQARADKKELFPAVVHVDGSARLHAVSFEHNPRFWNLLNAFERKSGFPVLLNTSFNGAGEPIVETPQDAAESFLRMNGASVLVLGNYLVTNHQLSGI